MMTDNNNDDHSNYLASYLYNYIFNSICFSVSHLFQTLLIVCNTNTDIYCYLHLLLNENIEVL